MCRDEHWSRVTLELKARVLVGGNAAVVTVHGQHRYSCSTEVVNAVTDMSERCEGLYLLDEIHITVFVFCTLPAIGQRTILCSKSDEIPRQLTHDDQTKAQHVCSTQHRWLAGSVQGACVHVD